jgi:hypothetical protein
MAVSYSRLSRLQSARDYRRLRLREARSYDKPHSVKIGGTRYECLDEGGAVRTGFGLEDEVVGIRAWRENGNGIL